MIKRTKSREIGINIPDDQWEQIGDKPRYKDYLLAGITINGLKLHLEAWAVTTGKDGVRKTCDVRLNADLAALENMNGTAFQTTTIMGREYVLIATPYGK